MNLHVKGHVVRFAIVVGVGDVVDGANSHRHLADGVDDGQVNDSPEEEGDSAERSTERLVKVAAKHKLKNQAQSAVWVKTFISN